MRPFEQLHVDHVHYGGRLHIIIVDLKLFYFDADFCDQPFQSIKSMNMIPFHSAFEVNIVVLRGCTVNIIMNEHKHAPPGTIANDNRINPSLKWPPTIIGTIP
jgi:hypothetical protein